MKYTRKDLTDNQVQLDIAVAEDEMKKYHETALRHLGKNAKIAGFRKGHAPLEVLERSVNGDQLSGVEINQAINDLLPQVIEQEDLQFFEQPEVLPTKYVAGSQLELRATLKVIPPVKLADPAKLKVKKPVAKIDKKQIDDTINQLRTSAAKRSSVERPAKMGDEVIIDFTGFHDDKAFDGGAAKDYSLELGSNMFIPGFEEGIVGHKAGDKFDVDVTFPREYGSKELAGKKAVFKINLKKVNELTLPELDDKFAQSLAADLKTVDDLRNDIERQLTERQTAELQHQYREAILDKLAEASKVTVPSELVDNQLPQMKREFAQNLMYRGLDLAGYLRQIGKTESEWEKDDLRANIEKQTRNSMVLRQVMKNYQITVDDKDVEAYQAKTMSHYTNPQLRQHFDTPEAKNQMRQQLLTDRIFDKLVELNEQE